jgi:hypothetical protein
MSRTSSTNLQARTPKPLSPSYVGQTGLDTVYDGAADSMSTAHLFGPRGGRWSTKQSYSQAFNSQTPRPWQAKPQQNHLHGAIVPLTANGPSDYQPYPASHTVSGSTGWNTRGRNGPMGHSFDSDRGSLAFCASSPRLRNSTTKYPKVPNKTLKEDAFILNFDARRESTQRRDFLQTLNRRTFGMHTPSTPFRAPYRPPATAPMGGTRR